jgi:hypothetical protein
MSDDHLLSSWRAAMIAETATRLSPEAKDLLIQELRQHAAAVQEYVSQLEQLVARAKEGGMPDDLVVSDSLGKAREASRLIVRTMAEAERLVCGGPS